MKDMLVSHILNNYELPQDWDDVIESRAYSYASDFLYDFITKEFDKWAKDNVSGFIRKSDYK